jgi:hypothetical protein
MIVDEYKHEDNGINIGNWDTPIYRIFQVDYLKELIKAHKNCLVQPQKWDDPFENFFLRSECVNKKGEHISLSSIHNDWYGQCWTTVKESDAMWRIYSPNKNGARVSTTVRKLFDKFYDYTDKRACLKYFIGEVRYISRADIEQFLNDTTFQDLSFGGMPHGFAKTLCMKRPEFTHESEVRLLFQDIEPKIGVNGLAYFPFNSNIILDEIALDPRLLDNEFEMTKTDLVNLRCTVPIIQSDLYQMTPATIRLE